MAYRSTPEVVIPSGTYWSPPRTKTLWSVKVGPYIGSNVVTSPVMINTYRKTSRTFGEKIQRVPEGPLTHSSAQ